MIFFHLKLKKKHLIIAVNMLNAQNKGGEKMQIQFPHPPNGRNDDLYGNQ